VTGFAPPSLADSRRWARRFAGWSLAVLAAAALLLVVGNRYAPDRPVDYRDDREHFYYGSIGSDIPAGLPVRVLKALPRLFPEYLPAGAARRDYTAFGFLQEPGHDLPIGFSIRRQIVDLAAINCAACHTGSVRETPTSAPIVIAGMPAITVDLMAFFRFLFDCAGDWRFSADTLLPEMAKDDALGPVDRELYSLLIQLMQRGVLARKARLAVFFSDDYPRFGPGRVNTFDTFKFDQFAATYFGHEIPRSELYGTVDFPSIWNQAPREGLRLHWDGNNTSVRERNFSAALGAGATPDSVDLPRMFRIEAWLRTLPPPSYPFAIDAERAQRGAAIYRQYCFRCHDFRGAAVGTVTPIDQIATDRHRLDSYTPFLLEAQQVYTRGKPWAFTHFSKTDGYANLPLDGLWARAPYLHNGSVPTLWDLLTPAAQRPQVFTRGGDVYDPVRFGFQHQVLTGSREAGYRDQRGDAYRGREFVFDTRETGNANIGHTGAAYGTELGDDDRRALIEYLKWQDRPPR
jgi:hypothetical protein